MSNYRLTNEAIQDLSEIWLYTAKTWSEKQADSYYKMLLNSCSEITKKINSGRNYPKVDKALYGLRASRHIIFYRIITNSKIEIIRILHEKMDLKNRLSDDNVDFPNV